jgi:hypothetical protein
MIAHEYRRAGKVEDTATNLRVAQAIQTEAFFSTDDTSARTYVILRDPYRSREYWP